MTQLCFSRSDLSATQAFGIGVPRQAWGLYKDIESGPHAFSTYTYSKWNDSGKEEIRSISAKKQQAWAERIYNDPRHATYVCTLSDCRGGQLIRSFAQAVIAQGLERSELSSQTVKWVRLNSSFDPQVTYDDSPEVGRTKPKLLILDNVHVEDTNVKISKLRDIIANYDDASVLILLAEHQHPMKLREHHQIVSQYGIHLKANFREDAEV